MQFLGKLDQATVIDDYGHHPTEIKNTILTLRESFPKSEISMVFQPHRFTRTKDLFEEFVEVLLSVDRLILLEIYSAGEKPIEGIHSKSLFTKIKSRGLEDIYLAKSNDQAFQFIKNNITKEKGILLIQGAGNISEISEKLIKENK